MRTRDFVLSLIGGLGLVITLAFLVRDCTLKESCLEYSKTSSVDSREIKDTYYPEKCKDFP